MEIFPDPDHIPQPSFKAYVEKLDEEFQKHVEAMLEEAFSALTKAEKLMIRPLIEVFQLKKDIELIGIQGKNQGEIKELEKKIKSRLDVINENGDIAHLVKKFNISLIDSHKKRSSKALAKMGADAILGFIEVLKASGELKH